MISKKGQVAIFVVVAVLIVAGLSLYFFVFSESSIYGIPEELVPVFDYYLDCITIETQTAVQLAEAQGGRVDIGDYIPGSEYAPFSSHLNFLGAGIPYWYYVSGNGVIKENVPTKNEISQEMEDFISEGLAYCSFEAFVERGFNVSSGDAEVQVDIEKERILVEVISDISVEKNGESARKTTHTVELDSKLGKFYGEALEIYNRQKNQAFLENYALDVLYAYAPVDGVEIQCAPKIWSTRAVTGNIREGLENNFASIKVGGDDYFSIDLATGEQVDFLYSKEWPTKIEIYGENVDEELMRSEPMGTQEGLGTMGFCYVPYHFVYDVQFPTMIQLLSGNEIFQFPVVVIIDNNEVRKADLSDGYVAEDEFDLCAFNDQPIEVNLYDMNLQMVDANISFECFDQRCKLGESSGGRFVGLAPKCVNGFISLKADGFSDTKVLMSTNEESYIDVLLEREFPVDVSLRVDSSLFEGNAIISFTRDDGVSKSVALPDFNEIELSEGIYEVRVYAYGNSSIRIPATTKYQCVDVPKEGLLGFFGSTEEKCFNIEVPETKVESALVAGGKTNTYILETDLVGGKLDVAVQGMPRPTSLEQLQKNFQLFDERSVALKFHEN